MTGPRNPSLFTVPPPARKRGRTRRGLDDTLRAYRELGRLDPVDAALVALARVAADEVDAAFTDPDESRYTRGTLVGRYHAVLSHLIARPDVGDDPVDDEFAGLFAELGHPPQP